MTWTGHMPPQIMITPQAFQKLRLYIDLCPMEIGGLGQVERDGHRFVITDLFILPQKVSPSETELDPAAMLEILAGCVADGRNPASLCLWWHSHADMDVEWSETDEDTIANFSGDLMISLVGNKAGDFACRLDIFSPNGQTLGDLSLTVVPRGDAEVDEAALRHTIMAEMYEKLQVVTRDCELYDSPVEMEFLSPLPVEFHAPEPPPSSTSDNR